MRFLMPWARRGFEVKPGERPYRRDQEVNMLISLKVLQ
jgi:hypothetical protein